MNKTLQNYFRKFLSEGAYSRPPGRAVCALSNARTLLEFGEMEEDGLVRVRAEEERESYFDVYGIPDTKREQKEIERQLDLHGCWIVIGEFYSETTDQWEIADSIGMNMGYSNPCDPFQNCYVPDLMYQAVRLAKQSQLSSGLITG